MAKLLQFVPVNLGSLKKENTKSEIQNEGLEDMDTQIPAQVERFLDRALKVIKSYNLSRRKEQYVIAKLIDALGMTPSELQQAVQKMKKNQIVKR